MPDAKVIRRVCERGLKMLVQDDVQVLKRTRITNVGDTKTINARNRLIEPDLFEATEKATIAILIAL